MGISKTILWVVGVIFAAIAIITFVFAIAEGNGGGIFYSVVLFGLPALVLLYLANKSDKPKDDAVLEALKMRYVNGEITKEELAEKRNELTYEDE